jgi:hypothetical protein
MIEVETRITRFRPREWVQLTPAFLQIMSFVPERVRALACFNQDLREERLHIGVLMPDGMIKMLGGEYWQRHKVCAPHIPAEGVRVEPYEGFSSQDFYIRRTELDEEYPTNPAPLTRVKLSRAHSRPGEPKSSLPQEEAAPNPRRKPKVGPIIEVLMEMYPPHGDVPDEPPRTDTWLLGQIETRHPELADTFSSTR